MFTSAIEESPQLSGLVQQIGGTGSYTRKAMRVQFCPISTQNWVKLLRSLGITILGDVVRIQPNHISFRSIDAVTQIHGIKSAAQKGEFYHSVIRPPDTPTNLLTESYLNFSYSDPLIERNTANHAPIRRTIGQAFGSRALSEFEPTIKKSILKYLDKLTSAAETTDDVEIDRWNNRLLFDVRSRLNKINGR